MAEPRSWVAERPTLLVPSGALWARLLLGFDLIGVGLVTLIDRDGTMQLSESTSRWTGITPAPRTLGRIAVVSSAALILVGVLVIVSDVAR
jgi:hypothetical protein